MSDERFDRIDATLSLLLAGQTELLSDVNELKAGQAELRRDVSKLSNGHDELRAAQDAMHLRQDATIDELARLDRTLAQMRNDMGVMHEELLDRIQAASDDSALRLEMNRRFDEVLAELRDHAIPGDAADRYFASKLNEHERRITGLENC